MKRKPPAMRRRTNQWKKLELFWQRFSFSMEKMFFPARFPGDEQRVCCWLRKIVGSSLANFTSSSNLQSHWRGLLEMSKVSRDSRLFQKADGIVENLLDFRSRTFKLSKHFRLIGKDSNWFPLRISLVNPSI